MSAPARSGNPFAALLRRDLKLAFRRWGELANPLIFFIVVSTLFPLALSPEPALLRDIGVGVLWVAALLASLLALDGLFRGDMDDGTLEQLILSPAPLTLLVVAKCIAHWVVAGLPLVLLAPIVAQAFFLPAEAAWTLTLALLLATPTLSFLGAVGAALTASLRKGAGILGILVLPLTMPLLIFGARATDMAARGESPVGPLLLLAALLALAVTLTPFAAAAALRISVD